MWLSGIPPTPAFATSGTGKQEPFRHGTVHLNQPKYEVWKNADLQEFEEQ